MGKLGSYTWTSALLRVSPVLTLLHFISQSRVILNTIKLSWALLWDWWSDSYGIMSCTALPAVWCCLWSTAMNWFSSSAWLLCPPSHTLAWFIIYKEYMVNKTFHLTLPQDSKVLWVVFPVVLTCSRPSIQTSHSISMRLEGCIWYLAVVKNTAPSRPWVRGLLTSTQRTETNAGSTSTVLHAGLNREVPYICWMFTFMVESITSSGFTPK